MKSSLLLLFPLLLAAAGCQATKSADPLAPTVAGPIPGVTITPPSPIDPSSVKVAVGSQPITLVAGNATTSGVRPLTYLFEVATDAGFTNKVFTGDNVTPGDGGKTNLKLPDPLQSGRTYYWRAQAHDGANTSAYSGPANFDVFTPIVIDLPTLVSPINVTTVSNLHPTFVIGNSPRSGPVGAITYTLELADSDAFSNKLAIWTVNEQPNQTSLPAPQDLIGAKTYYWHARGNDSTTTGPWSATQAFKTPVPVVIAPPPSGGGGGASGGSFPGLPPAGGGGTQLNRRPAGASIGVASSDLSSVVHTIAAAHPAAVQATCDNRNDMSFTYLVLVELRKIDNRWGFNCRRGVCSDPSEKIVVYHYGSGTSEGSHTIYLFQSMSGACNPEAADITDVTFQTTTGTYTLLGTFSNGTNGSSSVGR